MQALTEDYLNRFRGITFTYKEKKYGFHKSVMVKVGNAWLIGIEYEAYYTDVEKRIWHGKRFVRIVQDCPEFIKEIEKAYKKHG